MELHAILKSFDTATVLLHKVCAAEAPILSGILKQVNKKCRNMTGKEVEILPLLSFINSNLLLT